MSNPGRSSRGACRGYTLLELALALLVAGVLVVAVGGVVVMASRALPQAASATTPTTVSVARAADEIAAELRYATSFSEMTAHAVAFTVPDRTADGKEEVIRFAWSGTPGDPVTREFNGSVPSAFVAEADALALGYTKRRVSQTREVKAWSTSPETLLASFSGWSGVTASPMGQTVGTSAWNSQAFRIDPALLPAGARNIALTKVRLKLKKPLSGGSDALVSIHRRQAVGSQLPLSSSVGSTATVAFASLTTSYAWVTCSFADVVFPTFEPELCILIKGPVALSAQVQYLNAATAPADSNYYRWSADSGASWLPTSGWDRNDAYFEVWGTWQSESVQSIQTDAYYLSTVDVRIDAGGTLRTTARILNEPEVAGP